MPFNRLVAGLSCLAMLIFHPSAQAQAPAPTASAASQEAAGKKPSSARYAAAYDSLMSRVAAVHAQAEERMGLFTATKGSFGGLHRRVKSFAGVSSFLVKRQVVKQRAGTELEKVAYYDSYGRKVLTERYEEQKLTRLELLDYPSTPARFLAGRWLLVRGDYLQHSVRTPVSDITQTGEKKSAFQKTSYFFRPRAAGER